MNGSENSLRLPAPCNVIFIHKLVFLSPGQGIQNIQQQLLGQAMGGMGGQPMVQYQQQTQQVYQQSLGLQQVNKKFEKRKKKNEKTRFFHGVDDLHGFSSRT